MEGKSLEEKGPGRALAEAGSLREMVGWDEGGIQIHFFRPGLDPARRLLSAIGRPPLESIDRFLSNYNDQGHPYSSKLISNRCHDKTANMSDIAS